MGIINWALGNKFSEIYTKIMFFLDLDLRYFILCSHPLALLTSLPQSWIKICWYFYWTKLVEHVQMLNMVFAIWLQILSLLLLAKVIS